MDSVIQTKIAGADEGHRETIIGLLARENLPTKDLSESLHNFFIALDGDEVVGAIGLEHYDNCGLLRSMVVDREHRNKQIASALVEALENHAAMLELDCIYLLTETAAQYFERKGYERISRDEVPESVKRSSEYSGGCPASAIVMKKKISA